MPSVYKCPLGDQHCEELNRALALSAQNEQLAKDCVDCGLPMEDALATAQAQKEMARKIKAKFFPERV